MAVSLPTRIERDGAAPFWVEPLGDGLARLGVTESFLESLGPEGRELHLVGAEIVPPGRRLAPGDAVGFLHLPDRAADLRAPFALEVVELNQAAIDDPRLIRTSPYLRGWLLIARLAGEIPPA